VILVHGYHRIDAQLVLPLVRQSVEKECTRIAEGLCRKDDVTDWTLRIFRAKFRYFKANIEQMDVLMESKFSPLSKTGQNISRCGTCLKYMKYIDSRPQRLYCASCEETFNLPQNGSIKLYKGNKCPLDGFELLLFKVESQGGQEGKSYPLCPQCYNDPPFEKGPKKMMTCIECPHPSCEFSAAVNVVTKCPDRQCSGYLCLDSSQLPKWRMVCNTIWCSLIVKLPKETHRAKVDKEKKCQECGSNTIKLVFHKDKIQPSGLNGSLRQSVPVLLCHGCRWPRLCYHSFLFWIFSFQLWREDDEIRETTGGRGATFG